MKRWLIPLALGAVVVAAALAADFAAMYQHALRTFYDGDYDAAEAEFITVYQQKPDAPFAADAAFKAGECAYRSERYDAAVRHFTHYLRMYPLGTSADEARMRLQQARKKAGEHNLPLPALRREWGRPLVAWLGVIKANDEAKLDRLMAALARWGYNAVAVDAVRLPDRPAHRFVEGNPGAYFASTTMPVCNPALPRIIIAARKAGLLVIAVMPTRSLTLLQPDGLRDRRWDVETKAIVADADHLDISDEDTRKKLLTLAGELARSGPDAIWFDRDLAFAPDEGLSPVVLADAEKRLGKPLDLTAAFAESELLGSGHIARGNTRPVYTALCEARAEAASTLVDELVSAVQKAAPTCRIGVILPTAAAIDPIEGLRDVSLDVERIVRSKIDHLVGWADWRRRQLDCGLTAPEAYVSMRRLSARLRDAAGSPARAVVAFPATAPNSGRLLPEWELSEGIGHLLSAGPLGVALYEDVPRRPVAQLLTTNEEQRESE